MCVIVVVCCRCRVRCFVVVVLNWCCLWLFDVFVDVCSPLLLLVLLFVACCCRCVVVRVVSWLLLLS